MTPHHQPNFDPTSAAHWDAIVPGAEQSVFSHMVYSLENDVTQALAAGAALVPRGQTTGHALIYAVWGRNYGLLKRLLEHGFDPNALGYTAEGEYPQTALDAVADAYHDGGDKIDEMALDAMHSLLRKFGGKYACELPAA